MHTAWELQSVIPMLEFLSRPESAMETLGGSHLVGRRSPLGSSASSLELLSPQGFFLILLSLEYNMSAGKEREY